jgi:hypothetical protein
MGENRHPEGRQWKRGWLALFLASFVLTGVMFYLFYGFPHRNIGPEQPIPFSHRVHAGVKRINCRFCHPFVDRSQRAGIPSVEKCFFCHMYVIPLHPEIRKELAHYAGGKPVPWKRIYYVPDYVKFRHQPHVRWAKIDCDVCHGPVETLDRLRPVDFQMGFCIECHRQRQAQLDCWLACHH